MRKAKFKESISNWGQGIEVMRGLECIVLDESDSNYIVQYWINGMENNATIPKEYVSIVDEFVPVEEEIVEEHDEVIETPKPKNKTYKEKQQVKHLRQPGTYGVRRDN